MPLEKEIENAVVAEAKLLGWKVRKMASPGHRAASDRMFIKDGVVVFIEFKRPGQRPTKAQQKEIDDIIAHGGNAFSASSICLALAILKEALDA